MVQTRYNSAAFRAWKASSRAADASRSARAARRHAHKALRLVAGWERHMHWFLAGHREPFELVQEILDAARESNDADRRATRAWQRALRASKSAPSSHDPKALRTVDNALSSAATGQEIAKKAADRAERAWKKLAAYEPVADQVVRLP